MRLKFQIINLLPNFKKNLKVNFKETEKISNKTDKTISILDQYLELIYSTHGIIQANRSHRTNTPIDDRNATCQSRNAY